MSDYFFKRIHILRVLNGHRIVSFVRFQIGLVNRVRHLQDDYFLYVSDGNSLVRMAHANPERYGFGNRKCEIGYHRPYLTYRIRKIPPEPCLWHFPETRPGRSVNSRDRRGKNRGNIKNTRRNRRQGSEDGPVAQSFSSGF
jgi:hypothetical protein